MKWSFIIFGLVGIILVFGGIYLFKMKQETKQIQLEGLKEEGILRNANETVDSLSYSTDNKTVYFESKGVVIGQATLKSHEKYDDILKVPIGNGRVILWYEFSDFSEEYLSLLKGVEFIDMRESILNLTDEQKETIKDEEVDKFIVKNPNYLQPIQKDFSFVYFDGKNWIPYEKLDIPKGNITIGIQTNVRGGEFYDVILNVGDSKLDRHAVVEGTNAGFLTTAPSTDPEALSVVIDNAVISPKFTSPADAVRITEIGWWCANTSEESNFEVGLYAHNSSTDAPYTRLYVDNTNAKGTGIGWKVVNSLTWDISGSTVYWPAVQVDNTATATRTNYATTVGTRRALKASETTLNNPFSAGATMTNDRLVAIYLIYTTSAGGTECWTYTSGTKTLYVPNGCTYYQTGSGYI